MTRPKTARWLQVAKRASEFRLLLGSGEVSAAVQRADRAEAALRASQSQSLQSQVAWREHLSQPSFHVAEDTQFRRFQGVLNRVELQSTEAADQARRALAEAQLALRQVLGEKNALNAAIERMDELERADQAQQSQREADDVWVIAQRHQEGTR